jgi:hypothetical protein
MVWTWFLTVAVPTRKERAISLFDSRYSKRVAISFSRRGLGGRSEGGNMPEIIARIVVFRLERAIIRKTAKEQSREGEDDAIQR